MRKLIKIIILTIFFCPFCLQFVNAESIAGFSPSQWANAIRKAEGNPNYGVLLKLKKTTYRQACINTVRHKWRDYQKIHPNKPFINYLASKYCPVGAFNDPHGLNKNWIGNVSYWLKRGAL